MYIKSIELEGFKSYFRRTVINQWDSQFNAITGLNGSGKSNILDSICFVLGITNLTHVRASQLQDLVYKSGQGGIQKATVTITFDNSDERHKPLGYEQYNEIRVTREIVIGGKNKYMINGMNAQNTRVSDLFRSVGLNVNNPHFLIMQGRITKVLNMKPIEILSMIEEAAGTNLYKAKRDQTRKNIDKKAKEMVEINDKLDNEIEPAVGKLKKDRDDYNRLQKSRSELTQLETLVAARRYLNLKTAEEQHNGERKTKEEAIETMKTNIQERESKQKELKRTREQLIELNEQEKKSTEHQEAYNKAESVMKASKNKLNQLNDTRKDVNKKHNDTLKGIQKDEKMLATKTKNLEKFESEFATFAQQDKELTKGIADLEKKLDALAQGMDTDAEGNQKTVQQQATDAQSKLTELKTQRQVHTMNINQKKPELQRVQAELKKASGSVSGDQKQVDTLTAQINKLEQEIEAIGYSEQAEVQLTDAMHAKRHELENKQRSVQQFDAEHHLGIEYRDPKLPGNRQWDRSLVHGSVAQLIRMKKDGFGYALQAGCGGQMRNIVVETGEVAEAIIEGRCSNRRHNFYMVDEPPVGARRLDQRTLERAQAIARGKKANSKVWLALDLVDYDPRYEKIMWKTFGTQLITDNIDACNAISRELNLRVATLDGDMVDPQGTMSGGSRPNYAPFIDSLNRVADDRQAIHTIRRDIDRMNDELHRMHSVRARYNQKRDDLATKQSNLDLAQTRLANTDSARLNDDLKRLQQEIAESEAELARGQEEFDRTTNLAKELANKLKNLEDYKKKEEASAKKKLKEMRDELHKNETAHGNKRETLASDRKEIEDITEQIQTTRQEAVKLSERIAELDQEIEAQQELYNTDKEACDQAKAKLADYNEQIQKRKAEIEECEERMARLHKENNEDDLRLNDMQKNLVSHEKTMADIKSNIAKMERKWAFLITDAQFLGHEGSSYDFKGRNEEVLKEQYNALKEVCDKLEKGLNEDGINRLSEYEGKAKDLRQKKEKLEADKATLEDTMDALDKKKDDMIMEAWARINRDFGDIYSKLLPGTTAKLEPPQGSSPLDGLEVKVAFNGVWKESLTELSGGQRSLVALSLVLAMLKFKPAPLYILDEVDAALDLSHTQNIGTMIKEHFQGSQFIVVSLKEGMFNNANVLFKTKFADNTSSVMRIAKAAA